VKLDEILSPLSGRQKEVMEAILKTVDTDDLERGYKTFIGRVVRETEEVDSEKEDKVLAEGADVEKEDKVLAEGADVDGDDTANDKQETVVEGEVKTGDTEDVITESEENPELQAQLKAIQKLAGIK
jgi:hypothetical protein